ncbi:MAG: type IV conjugative transfer system protein TraE [Candidatus Cloacimonetes bacterium]|nr:type IV conjugative transfer system protein TraE [Candidatus Cloacimonadota bacterium]
MILTKFKNLKDNFIKENGLLKTLLVTEGVLIAYLVFVVVEKTDSQRTVFLPPQNTYKEFWVSGDTVSKTYLEMMGNFIAHNLLNISKDNSAQMIENILPLVDSQTYYEVKKELQKMHDYVKDNNLARSFYVGYIESAPNKIIVNGSLADSISNKIVRNQSIKLEITYRIKFGLFHIVNLNLIDERNK